MMISRYSSAKRAISTTPVLNKRQPIKRKNKFVFDYNNTLVRGAVDYNADIKGPAIEGDVTAKKESAFQKAVERRKNLFNGEIQPNDYYTFRTKLTRPEEDLSKIENNNGPHFKFGGTKVYIPHATITLLPNLPNMSPYYARFKVPRNFNKLDLKDYLYNLYDLKVFDIRSSLTRRKFLPSENSRGHFLSSQDKIMIVKMEKPFIWPAEVVSAEADEQNRKFMDQLKLLHEENKFKEGSDLMKPSSSHIFEGLGGHLEPLPQPFISRRVYDQWKEEIKDAKEVKENDLMVEELDKALEKLSIRKNDKLVDGEEVKKLE